LAGEPHAVAESQPKLFFVPVLMWCRMGWWLLSTQMTFLPNALAPGVECNADKIDERPVM
jgi:hypothetical protein